MLNFSAALVEGLSVEIASGLVRVAAVRFSDDASALFYLDEEQNAERIATRLREAEPTLLLIILI